MTATGAAAPLDAISAELVTEVERVLPIWVERQVRRLLEAHRGIPPDAAGIAGARAAGLRAAVEVSAELAALLSLDIDAQATTPLAIVRRATRFPAEVLRSAGVPEVVRSEFDERAFPGDVYGLVPATWGDVHPALHEPGLIWGAWKAKQHLDRRRSVSGD